MPAPTEPGVPKFTPSNPSHAIAPSTSPDCVAVGEAPVPRALRVITQDVTPVPKLSMMLYAAEASAPVNWLNVPAGTEEGLAAFLLTVKRTPRFDRPPPTIRLVL